jgi:hypothetical protein
MRVPQGSPWTVPLASTSVTSVPDAPQGHVEAVEFDGDRVLANSHLFKMEFGWWIEVAYSVSEGDIGRALEILKVEPFVTSCLMILTHASIQIWIFTFCGTSHQNYTNYMLDLYCLLRYESSPSLHEALLNNWLVNMTGKPGQWYEADLLQEHHNRWLEDMVQRHGGEFDDLFYRKTISLNVSHFLRIKEEIETTFGLDQRSKSHTSPHLRDEFRLLLNLYKEEELHSFRFGRSLGHAAKNAFALGYECLDSGKLAEYIRKSTAHVDVMAEVVDFEREQTEDTSDLHLDNLGSDISSSHSSQHDSLHCSVSQAGSNGSVEVPAEEPIIDAELRSRSDHVHFLDNFGQMMDIATDDEGSTEEESDMENDEGNDSPESDVE